MQLALYYYDLCPFCRRVLQILPDIQHPIELKDVLKHREYRQELIQGGGSPQVPCLRIETPQGVRWLYESLDIIDFLRSLPD